MSEKNKKAKKFDYIDPTECSYRDTVEKATAEPQKKG